MLRQLAFQRALEQPLRQVLEQTAASDDLLRPFSLQQRLSCHCLRSMRSQVRILPGAYSRIREYHAASDGVMEAPRMREVLGDEGECASRNRLARLMARDGLQGIPQRKQRRRKPTGPRPAYVRNHLERDFTATEPNTKWVTDVTYIRTAEDGSISAS